MFCFDFGRVAPEKAKSDQLENQNKMSSPNVFRNFQPVGLCVKLQEFGEH